MGEGSAGGLATGRSSGTWQVAPEGLLLEGALGVAGGRRRVQVGEATPPPPLEHEVGFKPRSSYGSPGGWRSGRPRTGGREGGPEQKHRG